MFSVNFFILTKLFSPTLSLKSNVYLAHHVVCFDFGFDTAVSGVWGGGKQLTSAVVVLYSYPVFWATDGSLGETPENLLKWITSDEGRVVHLSGLHPGRPALTLFAMQCE